jgi:hypothetical protein
MLSSCTKMSGEAKYNAHIVVVDNPDAVITYKGEVAGTATKPQFDLLYLKNGIRIKGQIVEQDTGRTIKIQTQDSSLYLYKSYEVEKIIRE